MGAVPKNENGPDSYSGCTSFTYFMAVFISGVF